MPESLPGSTTALREELEAATATFEDEQAAHQETLSLLAAANARADAANSKLAATDVERLQALSALAAARRECEGLRAALAKRVCAKCHGSGRVERDCDDPQCGDSTWDHYCNAGSDECPDCAALAVPAAASGEAIP